MAAICHLEFIMTLSYCTRKLHFMFRTLYQIFMTFGCVFFEIPCRPVFHVLAFWVEIAYFGFNFDDF